MTFRYFTNSEVGHSMQVPLASHDPQTVFSILQTAFSNNIAADGLSHLQTRVLTVLAWCVAVDMIEVYAHVLAVGPAQTWRPGPLTRPSSKETPCLGPFARLWIRYAVEPMTCTLQITNRTQLPDHPLRAAIRTHLHTGYQATTETLPVLFMLLFVFSRHSPVSLGATIAVRWLAHQDYSTSPR